MFHAKSQFVLCLCLFCVPLTQLLFVVSNGSSSSRPCLMSCVLLCFRHTHRGVCRQLVQTHPAPSRVRGRSPATS